MTPPNPSQRTSGRSPNREILLLLSGEGTSIPAAEARALLKMQDESSEVRTPERRVLIASADADPDEIASRIAFSRRAGFYVPDGTFSGEELQQLRSGTYRINVYDLNGGADQESLVSQVAGRVGGKVSLANPDLEVTIVHGDRDYFAITRPSVMRQDWTTRRPRKRAFFHPTAIFPKLSRAMVNLTRTRAGEILLDPFAGTGSLLLEAYELGMVPVGTDASATMVRGALRNQRWFGQTWLGIVRADVRRMPLRRADGIATDIPYGRASSTMGSDARRIMDNLLIFSADSLDEGRRLVVMHPDSIEAGRDDRFELEEQHQLYIHRKLTRAISVLRRV